MDLAAVLVIEVLNGIASLALTCIGLAIIFGMMRIINFAHGEFMMLGGYAAITATNELGINIWISMLVVAPIVVGLIGVVAERLLIRFLYGRMIDTLLATWGLSLFLIGLVTAIYGNTTTGISAPMGSFEIGAYSIAQYRILLIVLTVAIYVGIFMLMRHTKLGLIARGTMQNPDMARGLGVNTGRVYMLTFGFGAALTGFAGAVLAPITGAAPPMGIFFIAKAFVTVISGGHLPLIGTITATTLFGAIDGAVAFAYSSVVGEMSVLFVAIVLLRLLPMGITGRLRRGL